jgi:hypothetical protein
MRDRMIKTAEASKKIKIKVSRRFSLPVKFNHSFLLDFES